MSPYVFSKVGLGEFERVEQGRGGGEFDMVRRLLAFHAVNDRRQDFVGLFLDAVAVDVLKQKVEKVKPDVLKFKFSMGVYLADVTDSLEGGLFAHLGARCVGDVADEDGHEVGPKIARQLHDGHILDTLSGRGRPIPYEIEFVI